MEIMSEKEKVAMDVANDIINRSMHIDFMEPDDRAEILDIIVQAIMRSKLGLSE